jgi:hypothetical protein
MIANLKLSRNLPFVSGLINANIESFLLRNKCSLFPPGCGSVEQCGKNMRIQSRQSCLGFSFIWRHLNERTLFKKGHGLTAERLNTMDFVHNTYVDTFLAQNMHIVQLWLLAKIVKKLLGLWVLSVNNIHFYKLYLHSFNMAVRKRRHLKPSAPLTWYVVLGRTILLASMR